MEHTLDASSSYQRVRILPPPLLPICWSELPWRAPHEDAAEVSVPVPTPVTTAGEGVPPTVVSERLWKPCLHLRPQLEHALLMDVLSHGNTVQEVSHIPNGSHPGNSLLKVGNASQVKNLRNGIHACMRVVDTKSMQD